MPRDAVGYTGPSRLMSNYGWVQNTSNLSTVRDTVELLPAEGISHNDLMRRIYAFRADRGEIRQKWTWDARCRIKAICACGMAELDRDNAGYRLTACGRELQQAPRSTKMYRGNRVLSPEEVRIFQKGLLTSPPVIRVLTLLQDALRSGSLPLHKYDVGGRLGFVGDIGFTHFEPEYVVLMGRSFNDMEGDADKWARTILSWLTQVGWAVRTEPVVIGRQSLARFTAAPEVDRVLRYAAKSTVKYVPQEMLCSDHHPFPNVIQQRRAAILQVLSKTSAIQLEDLLHALHQDGMACDEETLRFDLLNLAQAGLHIVHEGTLYALRDKIQLDRLPDKPAGTIDMDFVEKEIQHYVTLYADTLPSRLVDNLIRYGYGGQKTAALFESAIDKLCRLIGYDSVCLGQGHGRVADVLAKYRTTPYPRSYALILDAKATSRYAFPAADVRKMKEYIGRHGPDLLAEGIPQHAFAFVSMDFERPDAHLLEIAGETGVNGTAITVYDLLALGDAVLQKKAEIGSLFSSFTTNTRYHG